MAKQPKKAKAPLFPEEDGLVAFPTDNGSHIFIRAANIVAIMEERNPAVLDPLMKPTRCQVWWIAGPPQPQPMPQVDIARLQTLVSSIPLPPDEARKLIKS